MFKIPRRLDDLLPAAAMEKVLDVLHQPEMYQHVKDAIGKVGGKEVHPLEKAQAAWQQTRLWLESVTSTDGSSRSPAKEILNGTGVLIDRDSTGVPVSSMLAFAHARAASAIRDAEQVRLRAKTVTKDCTQANEVVWVTDVASAVQACVNCLDIEEIVVARSDLVRIPGVGDVFQILKASGARIREVGANNQVRQEDWEAEFSDSTQLVVMASPNGLESSEAKQQREQTVAAANQANKQVLCLLADGVVSSAWADLLTAPEVKDVVQAKFMTVLPLNLLVAGPAGAALLGMTLPSGAANYVSDTGRGLSTAAIATAATALQLSASQEVGESSAVDFLATSIENLENRAKRMAVQLSGVGPIENAEAVSSVQALGAAPWDCYRLGSWAVRLSGDKDKIGAMATTGDFVLRLGESDGKLQIDLRFVDPADDHRFVELLTVSS